jgi:hypothetical protein
VEATAHRQTFELSPNLKPLAPVRDHVNVFTNLSHLEADTKGDGSGDPNRAAAAWLTGVHAYDRTRPGAEIRLATSVDQIAARHLGRDTQVPSVEVTTDAPSHGAFSSGVSSDLESDFLTSIDGLRSLWQRSPVLALHRGSA